jgi:hypothetical protein
MGWLVWMAVTACGCGGASFSPVDTGTAPGEPVGDDAAGDAGDAGDGASQANEAGVDLATYAGTYTGTYSGQDSGTITLTIDGRGNIALAAHSTWWGNFVATGTLGADGSATASGSGAGPGVTFTFTGSFVPGAGSGTWKTSNDASGTWMATR